MLVVLSMNIDQPNSGDFSWKSFFMESSQLEKYLAPNLRRGLALISFTCSHLLELTAALEDLLQCSRTSDACPEEL